MIKPGTRLLLTYEGDWDPYTVIVVDHTVHATHERMLVQFTHEPIEAELIKRGCVPALHGSMRGQWYEGDTVVRLKRAE